MNNQQMDFLKYWKENFKSSKDGFDYTMLFAGVTLAVIAAICKFGSFANPIENFIADAKLEKWGEIGAGLFFSVWCLLWLPFQRHRLTSAKHNARTKILDNEIIKLKKEIEDDNIKLEITSSLALEHDVTLHGLLTIKAVNYGKKVARIRRVAIYTEPAPLLPMPQGVTLTSSELNIGQKQAVVEIKGDEDMHEWQQVLNRNPRFLAHEKNCEKYGKGYIELTSGKQIEFEFVLMPDDAWGKLGFYGPPKVF